MIKTLEMLKFYKGYYVTARVNGRAMIHEYFKTKTLAMARVKELKKEGYEIEK